MTHIKLQVGCLIVLLYIAFIYFREAAGIRKKKLPTFFDVLLLLGIVSVIFDGATAYMVNDPRLMHSQLNRVCHAIFLICLNSDIFVLFLYMLRVTGLYPKRLRGKIDVYIPFIINVAVVLAGIDSLQYKVGNVTNYSMGLSAYTCFAMSAVYIALSLTAFVKRWNYIERKKRTSVFTYLAALAVVTGIQMIFPETLITSLAVLIFILGVYLNLEDPSLQRLTRYHSETVMAFANLIENRDSSTGGHIKRTSLYVELICDELRRNGQYMDVLTRDFIMNLTKAAPMHDIGKVSVPDAILQKKGKLTDEEFEIMKQHAASGGEIIRQTFAKLGSEEYQEMAYQVARHHHEKWNGAGYPDGLKGEEIPLSARIMAVADVFDAVSEKRCYRDAMPLEQCFSIIEEGGGTHFDPTIVSAFLNIRDKIVAVHGEITRGEV